MYQSFYNLRFKPFQKVADPEKLWLNEKNRQALASFKKGIEEGAGTLVLTGDDRAEIQDNTGILLLTGDVGTGKTTFINALVSSFQDEIIVGTIFDPGLIRLEFLNCIANAFHLGKEFTARKEFFLFFKKVLVKYALEGKKALLVVDEAQRLSAELLEEIRLLSNLRNKGARLINILLVGNSSFATVLFRAAHGDWRENILLAHNIEALTELETRDYIQYLLKRAGAEKEIFSPAAVREIHVFSGGIPRLINAICDLALLKGFSDEKERIEKKDIKECEQEFLLPDPHKKHKEIVEAARKVNRRLGRKRTGGSVLRGISYAALVSLFIAGAIGGAYLFLSGGVNEKTTLAQKVNGLIDRIGGMIFRQEQAGSPRAIGKDAVVSEQGEPVPAADSDLFASPAPGGGALNGEAPGPGIMPDMSPTPAEKEIRPFAAAPASGPESARQEEGAAKSKQISLLQPGIQSDIAHSPVEKEDTPAKAVPVGEEKTKNPVPALTVRSANRGRHKPVRQVKPKTASIRIRAGEQEQVPAAEPRPDIGPERKESEPSVTPPRPEEETDDPVAETAETDPESSAGIVRTGNPEAVSWSEKSYENMLRGRVDEAIEAAGRAISLDPGLVNPYINRAWAYSEKGLHDQAIRDCNTALELDPENAPALNNRGLAYQRKAETAKATADYKKACDRGLAVACDNYEKIAPAGSEQPEDVRLAALDWIQRSYESVIQRKFDQAIEAATRAIMLDPGQVNPYINRAWAYSETGAYDKALIDCNIALKRDPANALAYNNRGLAYNRKGEKEKALADYKKSCELGLEIGCGNYRDLLVVLP